MINQLMQEKKLSKYRLAKNSGIPYTTVNDICSGHAQLSKCSGETIYKIAKALNVSMEKLIAPCLETRISFELFKSNTCHRLKELGDLNFIIETLEEDEIQRYHDKKWYPESLYLLAMLDIYGLVAAAIVDFAIAFSLVYVYTPRDIRRYALKTTQFHYNVLTYFIILFVFTLIQWIL